MGSSGYHLYNYMLTGEKTFCGLSLEDVSKATTDRKTCSCRKCLAMTTTKGDFKRKRSIIAKKGQR